MGILGRTRISPRSFIFVTLSCATFFLLVFRSQVQDKDYKADGGGKDFVGGDVRDSDIMSRRHVASVPNGKQDPEVAEAFQEDIKQTLDPEIQTAMKKLEIRLGSKNDYKKGGNDSDTTRRHSTPLTEAEILDRLDKALKHHAKLCPKILPLGSGGSKILVIAGNGAGYGVVSDAFGNRHGVFTHTDPLDEILLNTNNSETNSTISELCRNLDTLNKCRVQHDSFDVFKKYQRKTVQRNEFIRDACSVSGIPGETEDICLTSTNILMKMCSRFPVKVLTTSSMTMSVATKIMKKDSTLNVIYLFRDPRAVISARSEHVPGFDFSKESLSLCHHLEGDLQVIDQLRRTDLAGRFYFLRYEDAALQPEIELSKLVESLSEKKLSTSKLFCFPSTNDGELSKYQWSFDKNPVEVVNSWKQTLPIESINAIEEECLNVLSQLEYPIIGRVD